MNLTEIYEKGQEIIGNRDIRLFTDYVETGFIAGHDRRIIDSYTFRQQVIDGPTEVSTECEILGIKLKTPIIQSAITIPIPAIMEDGLLLNGCTSTIERPTTSSRCLRAISSNSDPVERSPKAILAGVSWNIWSKIKRSYQDWQYAGMGTPAKSTPQTHGRRRVESNRRPAN